MLYQNAIVTAKPPGAWAQRISPYNFHWQWKAENRVRSDLSSSFSSFQFFAFADVTISPRRKTRASAENFVEAACVRGIGSRSFPRSAYDSSREAAAFLSFRGGGNDKLAGLQSLALIQLYNKSLLIKKFAHGIARGRGRGRGGMEARII